MKKKKDTGTLLFPNFECETGPKNNPTCETKYWKPLTKERGQRYLQFPPPPKPPGVRMVKKPYQSMVWTDEC